MNILYLSVHEVLEYDEMSLLQKLGHNVFCLGANYINAAAHELIDDVHVNIDRVRPAITFGADEISLFRSYEHLGGRYFSGQAPDQTLPPAFMDMIDVSIIMHNTMFIATFWSTLKRKPVIWRTIGQGVDHWEDAMRPFRDEGLKVVRYSPVEAGIPNTMGTDAIIRFGIDPEVFCGWEGNQRSVLMFSNNYETRYPNEARDFREIVNDMSYQLGGRDNLSFDGAVGLVDFSTQKSLYKESRVYLYASGLEIPYTLNFMEAWVTGCPVVVYAPEDRVGRYFEIDRLIDDGVNGFVCRDIVSAKKRLHELLEDYDLAKKISANGRAAAISEFGLSQIEGCWAALLDSI